MSSDSPRKPRFCGQCGTTLPQGEPRFCIECGHPVRQVIQSASQVAAPAPKAQVVPVAVGATVRLGNANVEQAVIGGTMRLATDQAIPPGLWFRANAPLPSDTIAIYAPLQAIVGAWSGQTSAGWQPVQLDQIILDDRGRRIFSFEIVRTWFPSANCGENLELKVKIGAYSTSKNHETRRGFHYRPGSDSPMSVVEAWWVNSSTGQRIERDLPIIQIMAPPRIPRVSDFQEGFANAKTLGIKPEDWAKQGKLPERFELQNTAQTRTEAGRGLVLLASARYGSGFFSRALSSSLSYRVLAHNPLIVPPGQWYQFSQRMRNDAKALGLDFGTEFDAEWWLDKHGHDAVVFEPSGRNDQRARRVVVFRRSQVMLDRT